MTISTTLKNFLTQRDVSYDIVAHRHTDTTVNSAVAAHVPVDKVAKAVILKDEKGFVMAVVPATDHVKIGKFNIALGRNMGLATEAELPALFTDCEPGVAPPVGEAYGLETIVDDSLLDREDVYLEAGDHTELIHLEGEAFRRLMDHARHACIT